MSAGPIRTSGKTVRAPPACATLYVVLLQVLLTWLDKWKNSRCCFQNQLAKKHCQEDKVGRSLNKDMGDLNI